MPTGSMKQHDNIKTIEGELEISKTNGVEVSPGIFLIGDPSPRPDISPTALVCLANIHGMLGLVELSIKFKEKI